jgi:hypothetical protein
MMLRRTVIALTLLALGLALCIPPTDLPETPYNEADTPFAAVPTASTHVDVPAAHLAVVSFQPLHLFINFRPQPDLLIPLPHARRVSLPIVLHVLLC